MRLVVYRHEGMKSSGAVYIHSYQFVARTAVRYARYCLFFIFILHWVRAHLLFTYFLPSARPHPRAGRPPAGTTESPIASTTAERPTLLR